MPFVGSKVLHKSTTSQAETTWIQLVTLWLDSSTISSQPAISEPWTLSLVLGKKEIASRKPKINFFISSRQSLGAHVCGATGKRTNGLMNSIFGLDPAGEIGSNWIWDGKFQKNFYKVHCSLSVIPPIDSMLETRNMLKPFTQTPLFWVGLKTDFRRKFYKAKLVQVSAIQLATLTITRELNYNFNIFSWIIKMKPSQKWRNRNARMQW